MTSPFGAMAVIADPRAGEGRVSRELDSLRRELDRRGLEYELALLREAGDGERLASEAARRGRRYLVAVGDDGTVQDVVNGLFDDGRTLVEDPVLGVVSAGSGCDLIRSLGLPDDVEGAVSHLTGETTYPLDVMKVTSASADGTTRRVRYAHNLAEVGFGAAVTRRLKRYPSWVGGAGRFLSFWSTYATFRVPRLRIAVDARERETRAWNVIVGNGQFSSGLRLSPRSFPGDGVLDALVFFGPKSDAYTMLPRIYRHGDHVPDPHIQELRARIRLAVDADRPLPVVADGAVLGTTPVSFQIVPQQIRVKL
jgi:diacylglycerol kinase (ATP)